MEDRKRLTMEDLIQCKKRMDESQIDTMEANAVIREQQAKAYQEMKDAIKGIKLYEELSPLGKLVYRFEKPFRYWIGNVQLTIKVVGGRKCLVSVNYDWSNVCKQWS